jgi:hypothetical protein
MSELSRVLSRPPRGSLPGARGLGAGAAAGRAARSAPERALRAARVTLAVWALALASLLPRAARADEPRRIPIVFHVAQREGSPVAPEAFIAEQLAAANSIFRPLGIELVDARRAALGPEHAELVTRADRDALVRHVERGVIDCFVIARLMDVDEPGRERRGVFWHPRPAPRKDFVIVSAISRPYVLAHELGHLFGNRQHSDVPGNLMSYQRGEGPPFLDEAQSRRVRQTLRAMLASRRLVPLPPAAGDAASQPPQGRGR